MYIVYIISTTSNTIEVDQLNQLLLAFESDLQLEPVQKNCSFDPCSLAQLRLELIVAMACSQLLAGAAATLPGSGVRELDGGRQAVSPRLIVACAGCHRVICIHLWVFFVTWALFVVWALFVIWGCRCG